MKALNSIAFITGATSGIGKEFANRFAASGYDLILTGRREPELKQVAEAISNEHHVKVEIMIGDLTDSNYCQALCERIKQAGNIEVLVNNAGFGIEDVFHMIKIEEIRSMLCTHMMATVELIHAVLPGMIRRRCGTIINLSSLGAFTPGFSKSLYLGTKAFIHYFTEALLPEVHKYGIRLQSLCPGMTVSDFHRHIKDETYRKKIHRLPFMLPEEVVARSFKALKRGVVLCIPGVLNKLLYLISRLLPIRVLMLISGSGKEQPEMRTKQIPVVELQHHHPMVFALKKAN